MKIITCLIKNWPLLMGITMYLVIIRIVTLEIGIGGMKKGRISTKMRKEPDVRKGKDELPDLPLYFEGWVKYLHYTEKENRKPKNFYKNTDFDLQFKKGITGAQLAEKEETV